MKTVSGCTPTAELQQAFSPACLLLLSHPRSAAGHLLLCARHPAGCLPRNGTASGVKACEPARWAQPDYERHLYSCPYYSLALTHSRPALRGEQ